MRALDLDSNIDEYEFSVRVTNCLEREGILTLRDLLEYDVDKLYKIPNFGKKSMKEVISFIDNIKNYLFSNGYEENSFNKVFKWLGISVVNDEKLQKIGISTIFDLIKLKNRKKVQSVLGKKYDSKIEKLNSLFLNYPYNNEDIIDILNFSVRAYNCLKRNDIKTIESLLELSEQDLLEMKNLGKKTKNEILFCINAINSFNSDLEFYEVEFDFDVQSLERIFDWQYLKFLNIGYLKESGYFINNVKDICELYLRMESKSSEYDIKEKREVIRIVTVLDDINRNLIENESDYLKSILSEYKITNKDISILSMRLEYTLEQIANKFNLTRERIRQIEVKKTNVILGFIYNTFIPNVVRQANFANYQKNNIKRAIYNSIYSDESVIIVIKGAKRIFDKNTYNHYDNFAKIVYKLIKNGYQPEINTIFNNYLTSLKSKESILNSNEINVTKLQLETIDRDRIETYLDGVKKLLKDEFIVRIKTDLLNFLEDKTINKSAMDNNFLIFFSKELESFLSSFYNIFHSNWMVKLSDKFYEFYRGCIRKFKYINARNLASDNYDKIESTLENAILVFDNESDKFLEMSQKIYNISKEIDFELLFEIFKLNKIKKLDNLISTRCTITEISYNYMKRNNIIIDATDEDSIDSLNEYFMKHNRYVFRSRNILNALPLEKKIVCLDYNRFMLKGFKPDFLANFLYDIKSNVKFDLHSFYESKRNLLNKYGIINISTLISIIEYYTNSSLEKFGENCYRFTTKKFCTEDETIIIGNELKEIIEKYKNPSYSNIFQKLRSDSIVYNKLIEHKIDTVSEFSAFIETLDLSDLNIFDKSRSSRIGEDKSQNLHNKLYTYEFGFSFSEYLNHLEKISNNALNTKYFNLRKYVQIEKDLFIHPNHIDSDYKMEVIKSLDGINCKFVTLKNIKSIIPNWINPYFAISILSKENDNYSPIEQHGKLKIDNPILSRRDSGIYSLYNLMHLVLMNEYKGSYTSSSVLQFLQEESILAQKQIPSYFFELGFAEVIEGIIVLKKNDELAVDNDEIFDMLDDYFE